MLPVSKPTLRIFSLPHGGCKQPNYVGPASYRIYANDVITALMRNRDTEIKEIVAVKLK